MVVDIFYDLMQYPQIFVIPSFLAVPMSFGPVIERERERESERESESLFNVLLCAPTQ